MNVCVCSNEMMEIYGEKSSIDSYGSNDEFDEAASYFSFEKEEALLPKGKYLSQMG